MGGQKVVAGQAIKIVVGRAIVGAEEGGAEL